MNLVEQLLFACCGRDATARARDLRDHDGTVLRHFRQRKAQPGEIGDVLVAGIREIAAGDLTGTLEEMADEMSEEEMPPEQLPSGDVIAREFQRFLRQRGSGPA